jgi:ATP/maltotriose-dependent transcriptional regulator MalT
MAGFGSPRQLRPLGESTAVTDLKQFQSRTFAHDRWFAGARLPTPCWVVDQANYRARDVTLTDSELTVINLIAQGATNRDVAQQLHLSPHTVKTHLHNAFAKLGITCRAQLTQLMRRPD